MVQVIPAVDVLGGKVVRLLRGSLPRSRSTGTIPWLSGAWIEQGGGSGPPGRPGRGEVGPIRTEVDCGIVSARGRGSLFRSGGGIPRCRHGPVPPSSAGPYGWCWGPLPSGLRRSWPKSEGPNSGGRGSTYSQGEAIGRRWSGQGIGLEAVLAGLRANGVDRLLVTSISRDGTIVEGARREPDPTGTEAWLPEMALIRVPAGSATSEICRHWHKPAAKQPLLAVLSTRSGSPSRRPGRSAKPRPPRRDHLRPPRAVSRSGPIPTRTRHRHRPQPRSGRRRSGPVLPDRSGQPLRDREKPPTPK